MVTIIVTMGRRVPTAHTVLLHSTRIWRRCVFAARSVSMRHHTVSAPHSHRNVRPAAPPSPVTTKRPCCKVTGSPIHMQEVFSPITHRNKHKAKKFPAASQEGLSLQLKQLRIESDNMPSPSSSRLHLPPCGHAVSCNPSHYTRHVWGLYYRLRYHHLGQTTYHIYIYIYIYRLIQNFHYITTQWRTNWTSLNNITCEHHLSTIIMIMWDRYWPSPQSSRNPVHISECNHWTMNWTR